MGMMNRISVDAIKVGTCFSAPVFFEDGVNMFLSDNKRASQYHVDALKRWPVPYLLTEGHEIDAPVVKKVEPVETLEEVEELEELDDLEDAELLEEDGLEEL